MKIERKRERRKGDNQKKNRRGLERELIGWIIAIMVLAFAFIAIGVILKKQGFDLIEFMSRNFRFR
jgi:hypothetical protein